jgi:hypothetical protein
VGHLQTVLIGFCLCRQTGRTPQAVPARRAAWARAQALRALRLRMVRRAPAFPLQSPIAGRTV